MTGNRPLLLHPVTIYQEVPGTALFSALNLRWLCPFSFKVSALTELKRGCQIPQSDELKLPCLIYLQKSHT